MKFAQVTQHAVAVGTDGPANAGSMSMCVWNSYHVQLFVR